MDAFVKNRYASFDNGIGAKIIHNQTSLEELSSYALRKKTPERPSSGRQEYLQSVINEILFR